MAETLEEFGDDLARDYLKAVARNWWVPDPSIVAKLPRVTCPACSKKNCQDAAHKPVRCGVCNAFISPRHIHLDFVGHADLTRALIEIDPGWQWEPVSFDEGGSPRIIQRGKMWVLWGRLTLLGKSMLCVGTCEVSELKSDVDKELIGDMLRNGGMRFGIFGALWSKTDGWQDDDASPNETAPSVVAPPEAPTKLEPGRVMANAELNISQPDKPLAAMTMRELLDFATANAITVSGTKSDIVRTLEPLVRAASGDEPWPVEGEGEVGGGVAAAATSTGAAPSRPEPEAIPFNPTVANAGSVRAGTNSALKADK